MESCLKCKESLATLKSMGTVAESLHAHVQDRWLYILSDLCVDEDGIWWEITGKYLFFSANAEHLLYIAQTEIISNGFHVAKIPIDTWGDPDYVLCLYDRDNSRGRELNERMKTVYKHLTDVRYRWWKLDADTLAGKYSPKFMGTLNQQGIKQLTFECNTCHTTKTVAHVGIVTYEPKCPKCGKQMKWV